MAFTFERDGILMEISNAIHIEDTRVATSVDWKSLLTRFKPRIQKENCKQRKKEQKKRQNEQKHKYKDLGQMAEKATREIWYGGP